MSALSELGLSSYEETVYRTLLVTGAITGAKLVESSGVPRGRIYDVLNNLKTRNLVRTQATEPTQYAAVEPATAVERLLAERTAELQQELARYWEVAAKTRSNLLPMSPADSSIWLGTLGSEEMQTALHEHIQTATTSVHAVVGPPYEAASWETLQREVAAFFDGAPADVSVSLLVSEQLLETAPETLFDTAAAHDANVDIRALADAPVSFDVIDQTIVTIDVPHPQTDGDRIGVVAVTDDDVVTEFERQFQSCWRDAAPITEREFSD